MMGRRIACIGLSLAALLSMGARPAPAAPQAPEEPARFSCPDDVPLNAQRSVMKVVSSGREVHTVLYSPTGQANGAAIVMLHGAGGLRSTLLRLDSRALQLASRGYHVALPQYYDASRGDGGRGGGNMGRWSGATDDVAAQLALTPGLEQGRSGVWGFSLGAWLAAEAAMDSDRLRSAVVVAGGTDVAAPRSTRRQIPILMLNARGDPVVHTDSARRYATNLRHRGAEVELRILDSRQHFFEPAIWCETFTATREFFDRTLLAP